MMQNDEFFNDDALSLWGITTEYVENTKKIFFYIKYKTAWSLEELYRLPIYLRDQYIKLFVELLEKEAPKK